MKKKKGFFSSPFLLSLHITTNLPALDIFFHLSIKTNKNKI